MIRIKQAGKSILGAKGRTLANVLFQTEGASVSLAIIMAIMAMIY